jgi:hypothetical protein
MTSFRQSISVLAFAGIVLGLMRARADDVYKIGGSLRAEVAIKKELAEPANFQFVDTPLTDAIEVLKEQHGIEIQLDLAALTGAGVGTDTPVNSHVSGVSLRSGLKLLLDQLELTYVIRNEVLLITSKTQAEQLLDTKVYPVGDLVRPEDDGLVVGMKPDFNTLIESITTTIAPTTWDEVGGPGSAAPFPIADALVVSQTDEVHEEIEKLLAWLRETRGKRAQLSTQQPKADETALTLKIYRLPAVFQAGQLATTAAPPSQSAEQPKPVPGTPVPEAKPSGDTVPPAVQPQFGGGALTAAGTGQAACADSSAQEMVEVIPMVIEPESWQMAGGQGAIHAVAGSLLVRQTEKVHRQIRRLLMALE